EVDRLLAVPVERGVGAAVRVEPEDRHVVRVYRGAVGVGVPDGDDLGRAGRLGVEGDAGAEVGVPDVDGLLAGPVERGVEGAVRVEAGDREVGATVVLRPGHDDLPVRLDDGRGREVDAPEIDRLEAGRAAGGVEGGVERAGRDEPVFQPLRGQHTLAPGHGILLAGTRSVPAG